MKKSPLFPIFCIIAFCSCALAAEMEVKLIKLNYRGAEEVIPLIKIFMSPEGQVVADARTNTLIIKDYPENIARIEEFLKGQDIPMPTVSITAQFLDNTATRAAGPPVRIIAGQGQWAAVVYPSASGTQAKSEALDIMVMSGSEATIAIGESVPYVQWFWTYAYNLGYITQNVVFERVATSLCVIPHVRGDVIRLRVIPQISWFSQKEKGVIKFREAATELEMRSGDSIAIAASSSKDSVINRVLQARYVGAPAGGYGSVTAGTIESSSVGSFSIILTAKVVKTFY
jgi:hypothetical protein